MNCDKYYINNKRMVSECNYLETGNALLQIHVLARGTGEHFSNMERLAQEPLNFSSTSNSQLVIFTEFIHSQNGDNILKVLVILKNFLYSTSSIVVFLSQDMWGEHTRSRIKRIDSRIDAKLGDLLNKQPKTLLRVETGLIVSQ